MASWKQPQLTYPNMGPTEEIRRLQHRLLFAYSRSRAAEFGVTESGIFDGPTAAALIIMQRYLVTLNAVPGLGGRRLVLKPEDFGVLTYDTKLALGVIVKDPVPTPAAPAPPISIVHFSINGAGSQWNMGYPFDIGELLDKEKCYHQPIGYNTAPIPMSKGVADGVAEFIAQLDRPRGPKGETCAELPWCATVYSMGAIVFMTVLMRILHGDLKRFKATYQGSVAFGNPAREQDHAHPGCSHPDGEGIAWTKAIHGTPDAHWDMVADKDMEGSSGDDLYTKLAKDDMSPGQVKNMRSVWQIINTGNPLSLGAAVAKLMLMPSFEGTVDAAKAAFAALNFFVVEQTGPHVTYQFIQPIPGDPRDCWRIALDYMNEIVARVPRR